MQMLLINFTENYRALMHTNSNLTMRYYQMGWEINGTQR